jgi:hypothetical protein
LRTCSLLLPAVLLSVVSWSCSLIRRGPWYAIALRPNIVRSRIFKGCPIIISNIALGAFGFHLLRTINRNYSRLIDQSVPTLNGLQTLTVMASEAMRSTNPVLLTDPNTTPAELANSARASIQRQTELREQVLRHDWIATARQQRLKVRDTGEAFNRAATDVIALIEANNVPEATKQRESVLRPAYNGYVATTTKAADLLHLASLDSSKNLSVRTGNLSRMMLGLASWPVMILGTFLLFILLFVISVLIKVTFFEEEPA